MMQFAKGTPNLDRKKRRASKMAGGKPEFKESELQLETEELLKSLGIEFLRLHDQIIDWLMDHAPLWILMLIEEYWEGFADLALFLDDGRYVIIELKNNIGTHRRKQRHFRSRVGRKHYHTCRSLDAVKSVLMDYGVITK